MFLNRAFLFRLSKDTPLPTPTHKYNAWADNRKSLGITPREQEDRKGGGGGEENDEERRFVNETQKKEWEEDQKVLGVWSCVFGGGGGGGDMCWKLRGVRG